MPLNPIVWNPNHQDPPLKKPTTTLEMVSRYHTHVLSPHQCGSCLVQVIEAPLHLVWSLVRRFDCPQGYKGFVKSCSMRDGDGGVGSVREVHVVSGLPAGTSIERLDKMDDEAHVTGFSIVGGDHRLENYHSTTTVHREEEKEEGGRTVVVESYVVDVPLGSTKEETCLFSDTIIKCNLRSLARITEKNQKMEMKN